MHHSKTCQIACLVVFLFLSPLTPVPIDAAKPTRETGPTLQSTDGQIVLENHALRAVFSRERGTLLRLTSKASGWEVQRRAKLGRSFRMHVPLPDRRNNLVLGHTQRSPQISLDTTTSSVSFTWQGLDSQHKRDLKIQFVGKVTIADKHLSFEAAITNHSDHVIENIEWPCLGDLSVPPGAEHFDHMRLSYGSMLTSPLYPEFQMQVGYWGVDYPQQFSKYPRSPFVLADSGQQGLYMGYHDSTLERLVMFTFRLKPGATRTDFFSSGTVPVTDEISGEPVHYELNAIHFTYLAQGETETLHPVVLQPYQGSWHQGVDCYKAWRKTWHPGRAEGMPHWINRVHSWQQIHINSPEDDLRVKYRDLVQYGLDCAEHQVAAIQLTGWTRYGQDRGNPSHDVDPRLGTAKDLAWAISQIQKLGVKVVLFNKFTWSDRSSDWFRNELIKYAVMEPYGDYYVHPGYTYQTASQFANINGRRLIPMCHSCPAWQQIVLREFKKSIALGADGMLYDENQHHGATHYCFNSEHGHRHPGHIFPGDITLAKMFHQTRKEERPDYLISGEGSYDLQTPYYGLHYIRISKDHVPAHRYIAPHAEIMIGVFGHDDRHLINQALMYRYILSYEPRNYKGRLQETPLTMDYGKRVDQLRKQYQNLLWHGEFRHTVGATVLAEDGNFDHYSVFVDPKSGRRAVVVVNPDAETPVPVAVSFPGKQRPLISATPEKPQPQASSGRATVPALSAVVFVEQ